MLIDTNIFVENCKNQKHARICADLMYAIKTDAIQEDIFITQFSLNAMEAMLSEKYEDFLYELLLLIHQGKIKVAKNKPEDDLSILAIKTDLNLDFDDACQFLATAQLGTYLVTYDKDFAKTSLKTKTPEEVIKELSS
jgi:predicted nucleic acid-binding protein